MGFSKLFFGLASAFSWGVGDFLGGLATRLGDVFQVVIVSQVFGGLFLAVMALAWNEPFPGWRDLLIGVSSGLCGSVGLTALYRGLAQGRMGIFAPVTAVITTFWPLLVSLVADGLPTGSQAVGIAIGLVGIWLLSFSGRNGFIEITELMLAATAGTGFGLFFVFVDQLSHETLFWPLVAGRGASIFLLAIVVLVMYILGLLTWAKPAVTSLALIIFAGIFDASGNILFKLATQSGRLDIAALLASFYPGTTVLLAWIFLGERLSKRQWLGVLLALLAVSLISA